jgi:hypothetical protein
MFHIKALQNLPKLEFLFSKYIIWQPCPTPVREKKIRPKVVIRVAGRFVFKQKNPNLGKHSEGHRLENIAIFFGRLEYFMDIWDILLPFGTFCDHLVHFSGFGTRHQEKSGNPGCHPILSSPKLPIELFSPRSLSIESADVSRFP